MSDTCGQDLRLDWYHPPKKSPLSIHLSLMGEHERDVTTRAMKKYSSIQSISIVRIGDADDSVTNASPGITRGLAAIITVCMNDDRPTKDWVNATND